MYVRNGVKFEQARYCSDILALGSQFPKFKGYVCIAILFFTSAQRFEYCRNQGQHVVL